jgi:hypothetical protein
MALYVPIAKRCHFFDNTQKPRCLIAAYDYDLWDTLKKEYGDARKP